MKIFTTTTQNNFEFESMEANGESYLVTKGKKLNISFKKMSANRYLMIKDNQTFNVTISGNDEGFDVLVNGAPFRVKVEDEQSRKMKKLVNSRSGVHGEKTVKAQIPGLIVDVLVKKDSKLKIGEPMLILEAMKMENVIKAPFDCEVSEVMVQTKDTVNQNQIMLKIKAI